MTTKRTSPARSGKTLLLASAAALLALFSTQTANAWIDYNGIWVSQDTLRRTYENHNRAFGTGKKSSKKSGKKKKQSQKKPQAYQYTYSQSVSQQTEDAFIQSLLDHAKSHNALDAAAEAKIRKMQSWNFIPTVRESLRRKGNQKDSVAQAMAFWLLINYGTIHKAQDMSVETGNLVDQLETVMSKDQQMLAMSDADKQRLAENLLWLALVQIVVQEEAGNDPAALQAAADQARNNLQSLGIDPDKMTIGKNGLALH